MSAEDAEELTVVIASKGRGLQYLIVLLSMHSSQRRIYIYIFFVQVLRQSRIHGFVYMEG